MPDCVGVDIGREGFSIAVVGRLRQAVVVRAFERRAYEGELPLGERAAIAAKAVADAGYGRMNVALSLSGADVFLSPLAVPFTKKAQIARTIKFEMEGHLPFDVDNGVMDFVPAGSTADGTRLLVAAMPQEAFTALTTPFEAAGLKVRLVTADVLSAPSLAALFGEKDFCLLDVNPNGWKLSVSAQGRLVFARAAQAAPADGVMERAVAVWFKQSMMAAPPDAAPARIFLTGALSAALDADKLSEAAGIQVQRVEMPEASVAGAAAARADEISRVGMAAVSAASALTLGRSDMDFYAVAYGKQNLIDRLFAPVAVGLALAAVLFGAIGWKSYGDASAHRAALAGAQAAEAEVWKEIFPREKAPQSVHASMTAAVDNLRRAGGEDVLSGRTAPFLKALYVVSRFPVQGGLKYDMFESRGGDVWVSAHADDAAAAYKLAADIKAEGSFAADVRDLRSENDRVTFWIIMTPTGGGNV